ncbi:MAG: hypothetical protein AAFZ04_12600 [Pseudomonadota bacterium]
MDDPDGFRAAGFLEAVFLLTVFLAADLRGVDFDPPRPNKVQPPPFFAEALRRLSATSRGFLPPDVLIKTSSESCSLFCANLNAIRRKLTPYRDFLTD